MHIKFYLRLFYVRVLQKIKYYNKYYTLEKILYIAYSLFSLMYNWYIAIAQLKLISFFFGLNENLKVNKNDKKTAVIN